MTQPLAPGAFAKALQDRRRTRRRRRLLGWGIGGGVAALLIAAVALAYFSPLLATRAVEVTGTSLLTQDEVRERAEVPLGLQLPRQDLDAVAARVRQLEPVRDVKVGIALPGTVRIQVTERTLAYQRTLADRVEWVDTEGVVFRRTADPSPGVVQVATSTEDPRLLRDIATVVTNIPGEALAELTGVTAPSVDRITLSLDGDRRVVWGSAEESELKGQVLAALLGVDAKVYDVSAPRHPTTK